MFIWPIDWSRIQSVSSRYWRAAPAHSTRALFKYLSRLNVNKLGGLKWKKEAFKNGQYWFRAGWEPARGRWCDHGAWCELRQWRAKRSKVHRGMPRRDRHTCLRVVSSFKVTCTSNWKYCKCFNIQLMHCKYLFN